jgi:hypothetical protein
VELYQQYKLSSDLCGDVSGSGHVTEYRPSFDQILLLKTTVESVVHYFIFSHTGFVTQNATETGRVRNQMFGWRDVPSPLASLERIPA